MKYIPYGHQDISSKDIEEVIKTLKSDYITQGPKIGEFENALAKKVGAKYAVVFNSGTAALHAAYFAFGLTKNDEFITSPMTFAATSNAGLYLGTKPVFCDIESETGNINPNLIQKLVNNHTKLIVPIHYGGYPVDLKKISIIAKKNGLGVIEDGCHAIGAKYYNSAIGDCKYSEMCIFSFHPVKHITTGEGGAVTTNNIKYFEKLKIFRTHGITKEKLVNPSPGGWYYEMQDLGFNYRMTDIQAALGISQLTRLKDSIERRREIASIYNKAFENNPHFDFLQEKSDFFSAYHLYPILLKEHLINKRGEIFEELRKNGIGVQVHYIPVHLHPYYQQNGYKNINCPNAEEFYQKEISIPMYPSMSNSDISHVINVLQKILKSHSNTSRLTLGTVQFGLKYGINNKAGKPSRVKSLEMLKVAYDRGIRYFDTAYAYGDAEEILGTFIESNNLKNKVNIISKLKPNILDGYSGDITDLVRNEIKGSLKRLKIDILDGYLLHTPEYIYKDDVIKAMKTCKKEGLIKNFGVSIYDEKEAVYAANIPVDYIQIPYSIFDQRLNKTKFFDIARKNKVKVFARSAFVQGLVFIKDKDIPENYKQARNYLNDFDHIIKGYNLTRLEASLSFSYNNTGIDHLVFGVDNIKQLNDDIKAANSLVVDKKYDKYSSEIKTRFENLEKSIIMPSLWKKKKPKVAVIIQARTGSTRLPNKVLLDLEGKTVLEQVIDRVKACEMVDQVIVATTINIKDLEIVKICSKSKTHVYCGSENDVLDRYYQAATLYDVDYIVRITSDCPLIDPNIIDQVVRYHFEKRADYTSNCQKATYPDGEDVEIFSTKILYKAWKNANLYSEREHVTPYIVNNPKIFKLSNYEFAEDLSNKRWTLDEPNDYEFIKTIFKNLYSKNKLFSFNDVLEYLKKNPKLENLNSHIKRNEGYSKSLKNDLMLSNY